MITLIASLWVRPYIYLLRNCWNISEISNCISKTMPELRNNTRNVPRSKTRHPHLSPNLKNTLTIVFSKVLFQFISWLMQANLSAEHDLSLFPKQNFKSSNWITRVPAFFLFRNSLTFPVFLHFSLTFFPQILENNIFSNANNYFLIIQLC